MSEIIIRLSEIAIETISEAASIRKIDKESLIEAILLEWTLKQMELAK